MSSRVLYEDPFPSKPRRTRRRKRKAKAHAYCEVQAQGEGPELPHYRPESESPQEWTATAPTVVPVFPAEPPNNVPQDNMLWYYGYRFHDGTCVATSTMVVPGSKGLRPTTMVPGSKGGGALLQGRRSPTTMAPFLKGKGGGAGVVPPPGLDHSPLLDGSCSPPNGATQREAQIMPLSPLVLHPRGLSSCEEDYTTTRTVVLPSSHPLVPTRGLPLSCLPRRRVIGGETSSPRRRVIGGVETSSPRRRVIGGETSSDYTLPSGVMGGITPRGVIGVPGGE